MPGCSNVMNLKSFGIVPFLILAGGTAGAHCATCHVQLPHRSGAYAVSLAVSQAVYARGVPIRVRVTIKNAHAQGLPSLRATP
jgi:hypothetical protein